MRFNDERGFNDEQRADDRRGPHRREHELLLEAAMAGDVAVDDPRLVARLMQCAECRELHEALLDTRELVEAAVRDERDVLANLDRARPAPGSERVAPVLRALAKQRRELQLVGAGARDGETPAASGGWSTRRIAGAVGIAASLVAAASIAQWLARSDDPTRDDEVLLGANTKSKLSPAGPVKDYSPLQWELDLPPGGRFEITVWSNVPGEVGALVDKIEACYDRKVTLEPSRTRDWPDRIRWRVRVFDASDTEVDAKEEEAERER